MHGRQVSLVACVWMEPRVVVTAQTYRMQPDVALKYRRHQTHTTQSSRPGESEYNTIAPDAIYLFAHPSLPVSFLNPSFNLINHFLFIICCSMFYI